MVKQFCAANGRSPVLEIKFSSAPKVQDTEISTLEHLLGKRQIWMKKEAENKESKSWKEKYDSAGVYLLNGNIKLCPIRERSLKAEGSASILV